MKLTKSTLKQIIKEEIEKVLLEEDLDALKSIGKGIGAAASKIGGTMRRVVDADYRDKKEAEERAAAGNAWRDAGGNTSSPAAAQAPHFGASPPSLEHWRGSWKGRTETRKGVGRRQRRS